MEIYNHVPLECLKLVHVGCHVLCHVLPNLTSDVVLGMDWLHVINPRIDWNAYSLSLDCRGQLYVFWVLNKVVLMVILRFVH